MGPDEVEENRKAWFFASCDIRNLEPVAVAAALQLRAQTTGMPQFYEAWRIDRQAADQLVMDLDLAVRAGKIRFERMEPLRVPPRFHAPVEVPVQPAKDRAIQRPPPDRYLRVRIVAGDQPRARRPYTLRLDDGSERKGTTAADGLVIEKLPVAVRQARICLESGEFGSEEHLVNLDALARASSIGGVQQRLRNAGFLASPTGQMDDETRGALAQFQERHEMGTKGTRGASGTGGSGGLEGKTKKKSRRPTAHEAQSASHRARGRG